MPNQDARPNPRRLLLLKIARPRCLAVGGGLRSGVAHSPPYWGRKYAVRAGIFYPTRALRGGITVLFGLLDADAMVVF